MLAPLKAEQAAKAAQQAALKAQCDAKGGQVNGSDCVLPPPPPPPPPAPLPVAAPPAPIAAPAGDIKSIITYWANHYGVSPSTLIRVAMCESSLNPQAVNPSDATGLFQQKTEYWAARAVTYGVPGASIFDVNAQAKVAAGMFADGLSYMWVCQ